MKFPSIPLKKPSQIRTCFNYISKSWERILQEQSPVRQLWNESLQITCFGTGFFLGVFQFGVLFQTNLRIIHQSMAELLPSDRQASIWFPDQDLTIASPLPRSPGERGNFLAHKKNQRKTPNFPWRVPGAAAVLFLLEKQVMKTETVIKSCV